MSEWPRSAPSVRNVSNLVFARQLYLIELPLRRDLDPELVFGGGAADRRLQLQRPGDDLRVQRRLRLQQAAVQEPRRAERRQDVAAGVRVRRARQGLRRAQRVGGAARHVRRGVHRRDPHRHGGRPQERRQLLLRFGRLGGESGRS